MGASFESVVIVAKSVHQARLMVALLQAEGIPARVDGECLVDEFAASQQLMNVLGTAVYVPTSALQRARDIIAPRHVDIAQLDESAMNCRPSDHSDSPRTTCEVPEVRPQPQASSARPSRAFQWVASGFALLFAFLWHRAISSYQDSNPEIYWYWDDNVLCEGLVKERRLVRKWYDIDMDGVYEQVEYYGVGGDLRAVSDRWGSGVYRRTQEFRPDGLRLTYIDKDADGLADSFVVSDQDGAELQEIRWVVGGGFESVEK